RKDRTTGNAEYSLGPDLLERANEGLRTRDVLGGGLLSSGTGPRLRMVGPGGLLGHRHSLLDAEGFCVFCAMYDWCLCNKKPLVP
ncbi:hypothetical protein ABZV24_39250, partial [Streptomyces sp. NPDC005251]|uniref:hypothetical protein n=1 Tax=Streptomyces sp. NPDC005251 TaxID=3157166 RepID=UPI0033A02B52